MSTVLRSSPPAKKNYYDIIAGLSAFDKSQDVVLSRTELEELTEEKEETQTDSMGNEFKDEIDDNKEKGEQKSNRQRRPILHDYLGGKVDTQELQTVQHDLSHTLLGGYVPKKQLESLSSLDFAQYFHKALECEESLQIYDLFIQPTQNKPIQSYFLGNTPDPGAIDAQVEETSAPLGPEKDPKVYQWTKPDGKIVKKVVICNRCHSRFSGQNRMKQLVQHHCKSTT